MMRCKNTASPKEAKTIMPVPHLRERPRAPFVGRSGRIRLRLAQRERDGRFVGFRREKERTFATREDLEAAYPQEGWAPS